MEYNQEVLERIRKWFNKHSSPDEVLLVVRKRNYSPRQIIENIEKRTPLGEELYRRMEESLGER